MQPNDTTLHWKRICFVESFFNAFPFCLPTLLFFLLLPPFSRSHSRLPPTPSLPTFLLYSLNQTCPRRLFPSRHKSLQQKEGTIRIQYQDPRAILALSKDNFKEDAQRVELGVGEGYLAAGNPDGVYVCGGVVLGNSYNSDMHNLFYVKSLQ